MSTSFWADVPPFTGPQVELSNNSGGTYAAYNGATVGQVVGPTGTQRFRRTFTIAAPLAPGNITIAITGDLGANPPNIPGHFVLDGVQIGPNLASVFGGSITIPTSTFTVGAHTLEFWVGQATIAGNTRLDTWSMTAIFAGLVPCNCCPTNESRCYDTGTTSLVDNQFNSVVLITPSAGAVYNLLPTRDGITATAALSGITNSSAGQTVTDTVIDYFYSTPKDHVINIQLWNQGGGDLTDFDGLSNATIVDLFDSYGNVLFTGPLNAGNGGAVFQTAVGNLNGVKRLRLRNVSKLNAGATVSPLWREINTQSQVPVTGRAISMNCDGTIIWFDQATGNQVVVPAPSTTLENKLAFFPTASTDNFGWIETGAPISGPPQPPNRTLPAPIFNDGGGIYRPHNGATGRWIIEKHVHSAAAGLGNLDIPAGAFPVDGGIYSDDQARIYVNGVLVPFVGSGTGNIGPQTVPVTWLAGDNIVSIEVNNTVAGGTSLAGKLFANTPVQSQFFIDCPSGNATPCNPAAPVANSQPWTIAPGGLSATKVVNGVTITATVLPTSTPGSILTATLPIGDGDPNALSNFVAIGPNPSFIDLEFDASVRQNSLVTRVIDIDAAGNETAIFSAPYNIPATSNVAIFVVNNPNRLTYLGSGTWGPTGGDNTSSQLTFAGLPWGGGLKVRVRFNTDGTGRFSQFDFGGSIQSQICS